MKLKSLLTTLFLCIFFFYSCKTQKSATKVADNAKSLLYKIEGKGIQPSYLYGTIHVLPQKDFNLKQKVANAIENTDLIVLELDMDDPSMMMDMMKYAMLPDSLSLDKIFSEEDLKKVDAELQQMGMNFQMLNKSKPLLIQQMLMMKMLGEQPASYEQTFIQMAAKSKKEILGLEDVAFQMSIFDKIPYADQAEDIMLMIDEPEKSMEMFEQMVEVYKTEDINALYELFADETYAMSTEELDIMIHERNKDWIPKIGEFAKKEKVFIGVGAGHLGGSQGVVNLLRKAGYSVTPVLD